MKKQLMVLCLSTFFLACPAGKQKKGPTTVEQHQSNVLPNESNSQSIGPQRDNSREDDAREDESFKGEDLLRSEAVDLERLVKPVENPELEGYCPVSLAQGKLEKGSPSCQTRYKGKVYQFKNEAAQRLFEENPERFLPEFDGNDPVIQAESGEKKAGNVKFFHRYQHKTFLFVNGKSRDRFLSNPSVFLSVDLEPAK